MSDFHGTIDDVSNIFNEGVLNLQTQVKDALGALAKNPSDPALLATYQSKLYEYQLYRTAQSNVIKAYKDLDSSIIQNFR